MKKISKKQVTKKIKTFVNDLDNDVREVMAKRSIVTELIGGMQDEKCRQMMYLALYTQFLKDKNASDEVIVRGVGEWLNNLRAGKMYKEIKRLDAMLTENNIEHTCERYLDGFQIRVGALSVVEHNTSYGHENDRLEIATIENNLVVAESVDGGLTAEDVYAKIVSNLKK